MRPSIALLLILPAAALAQPAPPTPADQLTNLQRINESRLHRVTDPILIFPYVTRADKDAVRAMAQAMQAGSAKAIAAAGANPDPESISQAQQQIVQLSRDLTLFLNSRRDLMWLIPRYQNLRAQELHLLQGAKPDSPFDINTANYLALLTSADIDAARTTKVKAILNTLDADLRKLKQDAAANPPANFARTLQITATVGDKITAASNAIYALLTPDQQFDLDWALIHSMPAADDQALRILAYATMPATLHAPQDGTYLLISDPPREPAPTTGNNTEDSRGGARAGSPLPPPKQLAAVILKKGDSLGFKTSGPATSAFATTQSFPLPDLQSPTHWELARE